MEVKEAIQEKNNKKHCNVTNNNILLSKAQCVLNVVVKVMQVGWGCSNPKVYTIIATVSHSQ